MVSGLLAAEHRVRDGEQVAETEDRVQRRAQLVGHVREERRLQVALAVELGLRVLELGIALDESGLGPLQVGAVLGQFGLPRVEVIA